MEWSGFGGKNDGENRMLVGGCDVLRWWRGKEVLED